MEGVSSKEERVAFLTETYDLSRKNALALYLAEMGYSHSGIAQALNVTKGTAKKYLRRLENRVGEGVTESLPKSVRYPTYPGDVPKSEIRYSGNHVDIPDSMEDREVSLNRGCKLADIPDELINI